MIQALTGLALVILAAFVFAYWRDTRIREPRTLDHYLAESERANSPEVRQLRDAFDHKD